MLVTLWRRKIKDVGDKIIMLATFVIILVILKRIKSVSNI